MSTPDLQQALTLIKQGDTHKAIALLNHLIDVLPFYTAAHVTLAYAYEMAEAPGEALTAWQRARYLMPGSPAIKQGIKRMLSMLSPAASEGLLPAEPLPENALEPSTTFVWLPTKATRSPRKLAVNLNTPEPTASPKYEDLDRLIEELESARIVPSPNLDTIPTPNLDDEIEDIVSETLAKIYASQDQYEEAARVYDQLARQQPERAEEYNRKALEMRSRVGRKS